MTPQLYYLYLNAFDVAAMVALMLVAIHWLFILTRRPHTT